MGDGRMEPGIGTQVGDVAEDAVSRRFGVVVRGYDRQQVDGLIGELEDRARQGREEAAAAERELARARMQVEDQERPSYSGLGSRIGQLFFLDDKATTEL